jgi:hypothetical protein
MAIVAVHIMCDWKNVTLETKFGLSDIVSHIDTTMCGSLNF